MSWSTGAKELRVRAGLAAEQASEEDIAATDLGGKDMIAIDPADWPRLRLVVEVLYRLIEQDGIAAGPVWLIEQGIGWSWANNTCAAPGTPAAAPTTRAATSPATRPGQELGGVRKS